MLLYTRKVQNSARVDMPRDVQILLLVVAFLTLLMQRLGKQTTKLLITTVSLPFYLILNIRLNNIPENSSEHSFWLPTSNTLRNLG